MNCLDSKAGAYDDAVEGGSCDFCLVSRPCSSERMLDACRETGLASNRLSSVSTTSFFAASPVGAIGIVVGIVVANDANVSVLEKVLGRVGPKK